VSKNRKGRAFYENKPVVVMIDNYLSLEEVTEGLKEVFDFHFRLTTMTSSGRPAEEIAAYVREGLNKFPSDCIPMAFHLITPFEQLSKRFRINPKKKKTGAK